MSELKEPRSEFVEGVLTVSRYGVERELLRMRRSVESLPPELREEITEYLCDSKVGNHYVIHLRSASAAVAIERYLSPLRGSATFVHRGEAIRYFLAT